MEVRGSRRLRPRNVPISARSLSLSPHFRGIIRGPRSPKTTGRVLAPVPYVRPPHVRLEHRARRDEHVEEVGLPAIRAAAAALRDQEPSPQVRKAAVRPRARAVRRCPASPAAPAFRIRRVPEQRLTHRGFEGPSSFLEHPFRNAQSGHHCPRRLAQPRVLAS